MTTKPTYDELLQRVEDLKREFARHEEEEEALLDSRSKLIRLLDIVPYPLLVTDRNSITLYLNTGFTDTFGWTREELVGEKIRFTPPELRKMTKEKIELLIQEGKSDLQDAKRMTKDGRVLDVAIRSAFYEGQGKEPGHIVSILRDITQEKKTARIKDAMLRISMALPKYPSLKERLDYINAEVKSLIGSEGAVTLLMDFEKDDFFTLSSAYDDQDTLLRTREIRFSKDEVAATRVVETGKPVVIHKPSEQPALYKKRDEKLGHTTRNLLEVPLRGQSRIFGVVGAINKKEGRFEEADVETLMMIAGTVALSIENARVSEKLRNAYDEVTSLNKAKDKAIHHLSHELRTPVAILKGSLKLLRGQLQGLPEGQWKTNLERIDRSLNRIMEIESEVDDIMRDREAKSYDMLSTILDQCGDELETLIAEEVGEGPVIGRVREKIEEIFGPKEAVSKKIRLHEFVRQRLDELRPSFAHRVLDIHTDLEAVPPILIPNDVLQKVFDGLLKNAVENTPDGGRIDVGVQKMGADMVMTVRDYGVGINEEPQKRIFEGFFDTREIMAYSSGRPFDFGAGGRGADLLRMKIFSERYNFRLDMDSSRCPYISDGSDRCPGRISACPECKERRDCYDSGGTTFTVTFPQAV
jgi:PAS domain S-box-containing protein